MRRFTGTLLAVLCGSLFTVAAAGVDKMTTTSDSPDGRSVAIIDGKWLRAGTP